MPSASNSICRPLTIVYSLGIGPILSLSGTAGQPDWLEDLPFTLSDPHSLPHQIRESSAPQHNFSNAEERRPLATQVCINQPWGFTRAGLWKNTDLSCAEAISHGHFQPSLTRRWKDSWGGRGGDWKKLQCKHLQASGTQTSAVWMQWPAQTGVTQRSLTLRWQWLCLASQEAHCKTGQAFIRSAQAHAHTQSDS